MALPGANPPAGRGLVRLASATVLMPPAVAAVVLGTPYFEALTMVGAAILAWEWVGLCGKRIGWLAAGCAYILIPCWVLIDLRAAPTLGLETVLWLFAVVWAADSGAYFVGRGIGGPKLAPAVSPKKTWAGLFGAIVCAGMTGWGTAVILELDETAALAGTSAALGIVAQAGDLLESWVKRRFEKKDMSNLIPGHGGLFDRVDGLLAASVAIAAVHAMRERSVLLWG